MNLLSWEIYSLRNHEILSQFSVTEEDETTTYYASASANNVLASWRRCRDDPELGCQGCFQQVLVWGQPAAWCDQVICSWMSDYIKSLYPQCIQVVDCLGSQWEPAVLCRCWCNQQLQIPIAPNGTSFLQPADTHVHSQLKACIRAQKARLEEEWDRQSELNGQMRQYQWGPPQVLTVLSEACADFRERHQLPFPAAQRSTDEGTVYGPEPRPKRNLFLKAFIQDQLLVFRPDQNHELKLFETFEQGWEKEVPRFPPNRGIAPSVASKRANNGQRWENGEPPEADWSQLDHIGNYLHQVHHQEKVDNANEPILDMRFQGLELTPEQVEMIRPPEERMKELPAVRKSVVTKQAQMRRITQVRRRKTGKWASKLKGRQNKKASASWSTSLKQAGSAKKLVQSLALKASKSKRLNKKAANQRAWARKAAKKAGQTPEPPTITFQDIDDHALLNQRVRVISARTQPSRFASVGVVKAAQMRTISGQSPPVVLLSLEFSSLSGDVIWIPVDEVHSIEQEADCVPPGPFRLDYQHFRIQAKVNIKKELGCGQDASGLETVQSGQQVEATTLHAGMLELVQRLRLPGLMLVTPGTSKSLSTHDTAQDFIKGSNLEMYQVLLAEIASSTQIAVPVHAGSHYTYLHGSRQQPEGQWQLEYFDSLPAESASCYDAATSVAKHLQLLPASGVLPHSLPGAQMDVWTCGLWALQHMETSIRKARNEFVGKPCTVQQIQDRVNEFVLKLKPAPPPVAKGKAKGKAKAKAQPVQHATLQDALTAAMSCKKCRQTKLGQKGCSQCMGTWFQTLRSKKAFRELEYVYLTYSNTCIEVSVCVYIYASRSCCIYK